MRKKSVIVIALIVMMPLLLAACSNQQDEILNRLDDLENRIDFLEQELDNADSTAAQATIPPEEAAIQITEPDNTDMAISAEQEITYATVLEILKNVHITASIDDCFAGGWIESDSTDKVFLYLVYDCDLSDQVKSALSEAVESNSAIDSDLVFEGKGAYAIFNGNMINLQIDDNEDIAIGYDLVEYDAITKIKALNEFYFDYEDYLVSQDMISQFGFENFTYTYCLDDDRCVSTVLNICDISYDVANDEYDYFSDKLLGENDYSLPVGESGDEINGVAEDGVPMSIIVRIANEEDGSWEIMISRIYE